MKKCISFWMILTFFLGSWLTKSTFAQETEIIYFNYPIPVESYNPYSFNSRNLGAPSANGRHSGEDINLLESTPVDVVSTGTLRRYKQDGAYPEGYGEFYAETTHQLNRLLKVVLGDGGTDQSNIFMFIYGHIRKREDRNDPNTELTWPTGATLSIPVAYNDRIGYVNDDANNGDGAEHLHLGVRPDHNVNEPFGYEKLPEAPLSDYSPAHLVIAASRVGVIQDPSFGTVYWDGIEDNGITERSEAFIDKWWEKDAQGNYKYMELNNYHNLLGRPHNNHPNAPNEGTDFVHWWGTGDHPSNGPGVWIQDMYQPYATDQNGNQLSRLDDGYTALIFNTHTVKVYLLHGAIRVWYLNNSGYQYGAPFTDEIVLPLANSPDGSHNTLAPATAEVVGQKFGNPDGIRKTIMHNPATGQTIQTGMGIFHIGEPNQSGEQWYIQVDSPSGDPLDGSNDKPWPAAGFPAPTEDWWTVADDAYHFVTHDVNGNRVGGSAFTVEILEGNNQFADPSNGDPGANPLAMVNLSATVNSSNLVDISWTDPNSPNATPYQVNRGDGVTFSGITTQFYLDNTVVPGQTYIYTISGNGTPESDPASATIPLPTSPSLRTPIDATIFGTVDVGGSKDETTTIYNDGDGVLVISGAEKYYGSDEFAVISSFPINIGANSSAQIMVRFSPTAFGSQTATFRLTNNDVNQNPAQFNMAGQAGFEQPPDFPLTVQAETMEGVGLQVPGVGRKLTTPDTPQQWYIFQQIPLPQGGWVQIEVTAKSEGDVNGQWPRLETKLEGQGLAVQEIASTDWAGYFYSTNISQGGTKSFEIVLDEVTRQTAGHAVIVDSSVISYYEPLSVLGINPTSLNFGINQDQLTFDIFNVGDGTLEWNVTTSTSWITSVLPNSGLDNGTVTVSVDRSGLAFSNHEGLVTVTSNGGDLDVMVKMVRESPLVFRVERATGDVFAKGSFIPSGADLAERINVSEPVEPGDVVELDPSKPGHYRKARGQSRLIAGVITTKPGFILGNSPEESDLATVIAVEKVSRFGEAGRPLLALMGRVPVKATTENGPIRLGDLLTISSKPGYAMRCTEAKECNGAIIGKALEGLERGEGMILVLVMN